MDDDDRQRGAKESGRADGLVTDGELAQVIANVDIERGIIIRDKGKGKEVINSEEEDDTSETDSMDGSDGQSLYVRSPFR